jgi:cysteinyl-tRNA synthetase
VLLPLNSRHDALTWYSQIILRARQNHLIEELRLRTTSLSPSIIAETREAWANFVLSKKLSKGLPDADRPTPGTEAESWPSLIQKFNDKSWRTECLKRDEKFEMNFTSAVSTLTYARRCLGHI